MSNEREGLLEMLLPGLTLDGRASKEIRVVIYDPLFRNSTGPVPTGGPRYFRTTLLPRLKQEFESRSIPDSALHHITRAEFKRPFWQLLKHEVNSTTVVIPTSEDPRVAWPALFSAVTKGGRVLLPVMHCISPPRERLGSKMRNMLAFYNQRALILTSNRLRFSLLTINDHTGRQLRSLAPRSVSRVLRPNNQSPAISVKRKDRAHDPLQIICIGRQSEHKGSLELPRIAAALAQQGVYFQMHIVGDEPTRIAVASQRLASKLGVGRMMIRHGRVAEREKAALLADSHVLINPSHEEGYSYVIEEAVNLGIPAIAWGLPEMLSVWQANPLVYLVPTYEVDRFALALLQAVGTNRPDSPPR